MSADMAPVRSPALTVGAAPSGAAVREPRLCAASRGVPYFTPGRHTAQAPPDVIIDGRAPAPYALD